MPTPMELAQTPTPPVASNPTPTATTGVQPQAIAGNTPGAAAEGGTARDSPLLVCMTSASGVSLGGNVHSSPGKGARAGWKGGLVHVDRKVFVREMGFSMDAGGLPACLGLHREPSPIYTHCGDIFRKLQAKVRSHTTSPLGVRARGDWAARNLTRYFMLTATSNRCVHLQEAGSDGVCPPKSLRIPTNEITDQ